MEIACEDERKASILRQRKEESGLYGKYEYVDYDDELDMEIPGKEGMWLIKTPNGTIPVTSLIRVTTDPFKDLEHRTMEEGDFLLVAAPKAGTHWMWETMRMLVTGTSEYKTDNKLSQWIELLSYDSIIKYDKPRVLNTHIPLSYLPPNFRHADTKTIVMLRNPKDVFVSYYKHIKQFMPRNPASCTWNNMFRYQLHSKLANFGKYLDHTADTWDNHRSDPNVLIVFYEDLKRHTEREILRVAQHLAVHHTPQLISEIAAAIDITKMKSGKFESEAKIRKTYREDVSLYRKGAIGDWKNYFTVAQNEEFHRVYNEWNKHRQVPFIFE